MRGIFIFLWAVVAFLAQVYPSHGEPAEAYYPLKPGMTWEYSVISSQAGTGKLIITNLPERELDGKKLIPQEWKMGGHVKYYLIAQDSYGIYRYAEQKSPSAEPVVATPKVYHMKEPVDKGTTWDVVTKMDNRQVKINLTIEKTNDVVQVPAGTFNNCVQVKHEGEIQGEEGKSPLAVLAYEWYAPGTGLVKSLVTMKEKSKEAKPAETLTYQLESFKP